MISERLFRRFYPDASHDGTVAFYEMIRAALGPDSVVLNLGAGPATKDPRRILRGEVARIAGADYDPVVLENDELDDAKVIEGRRLPYDDAEFDFIVSDFVLEHVEDGPLFLSEACRVLRPGGAMFVRTPNQLHYVAAISRATPHWFHNLVANRARGLSTEAHEPWPTFYRLNTRRRLARVAKEAGFAGVDLHVWEAEPSYLKFNTLAFVLGVGYERVVNRFSFLEDVRATILGRLEK